MSKTVAIVQARMGSSRFPGKMLASLGDHRIIDWVFHRTALARSVDAIVLATSNLPQDESLVNVAKNRGVPVFRGDERDVLDRFLGAARMMNAGIVVRVCADNPFIDPVEIDRLVEFFAGNECDYACNHLDRFGSGYADGFGAEIARVETLESVAREVRDTRYREHVTLYIVDHPDRFSLRAPKAPDSLAHPNLRFDVDTPQDLVNLTRIVSAGAKLDTCAADIVGIVLASAIA